MILGHIGPIVHIGVIGLGARGFSQLKLLMSMEDIRVVALCDRYDDRLQLATEYVTEHQGERRPIATPDNQRFFECADMDAVLIMTSWQTHIPLALDAMKSGVIPGLEVGGASSLQECWDLVHASENSGIPVMLLENCCYGKEEMALLNMVRQGLFGELVHCRGAYAHDLRDEIGEGDLRRHYRLENFLHRNGELYPTHELGPIAKYLNLNRGNRMLTLSSMASKAKGQQAWLKQHRPDSPLCEIEFCQGDVVTTMIQCMKGETILLTHDCTLPRPYSRGGRIQGTKGIWQEDNRSIYIEGYSPVDSSHWTHRWESDEKYMVEYQHPLWKEYEAFGLRGGHGGMDYLVLRAFIESIQQKQPFPIDVYDCASWMSITPLSEASVAMGGIPIPIPDFTNGKFMTDRPRHQGIFALDNQRFYPQSSTTYN